MVFGSFSPNTGNAAGFNDVSSDYIFYDEVVYLSSKGYITGYGDNTFKTGDTVTRAQAAIMIGRALGLNGDPRDTKFSDVVANVTGSGYIASAVDKGIISGFADGTFRPNQPVTRGQMAIFLNRAFTLNAGNVNNFTDVSANMASYQAIINVASNGIAGGYTDGTYRPDQHLNRGQFSAFLARTLEPSFRVDPLAKPVPAPTPQPSPVPIPNPEPTPDVNSGTYVIPGAPTSFQNCTAMREYYPSGVQSSHPAYASKHDRDNDGWACER
nr:S-layer homology domain-containing protein [Bacillus benzoevorans]